jgi:5,6,7,8-tetrahydromethanopterin hydro-lyase
VADGVIPAAGVDELVLIAAVWVSPEADDAEAVYRNNRTATREALAAGRRCEPKLDAALAARSRPENPFFRPRA